MSLGISIDHVISMSLPWLGGWIWDTYGYTMVFTGAGFVAILMLIFSAMIKTTAPVTSSLQSSTQ